MVQGKIRTLCVALMIALVGGAARAESLELTWDDLIPPSTQSLTEQALDFAAERPSGFVEHGFLLDIDYEAGQKVVEALDGQVVSIPGYALPLDWKPEGAREFLLVPYVGACVHVPPPPANQIIHVTSADPIKFEYAFEPFVITGVMSTERLTTDLAEHIGYQMALTGYEVFETDW